MKTLAIFLAASSLAFAGAVGAQSQEHLTLRIKAGSAMVSNGGDFAPAQSGQAVSPGDKLSIDADTDVQAVYDRGTADTGDDCVIEFKGKPGVYVVPRDCKPAGAWVAGSNGVNIWTVGAVAVLLGATLGDSHEEPVSQGAL